MSIYFLSGIAGFISLTIEILWVRLFSLANYSLPQAFAFVLIFYLIGIAFGAQLGKKLCAKDNTLWFYAALAMFFSGLTDLSMPWIYTYLHTAKNQLFIGGFCIAVCAFSKAIIFPIVHYLGVIEKQNNSGMQLAKIYAANIFGATLGPIFAAMILLKFATLQQSFFVCALFAFLTCVAIMPKKFGYQLRYLGVLAACALFSAILFLDSQGLIKSVLVQGEIKQIIENEYGVIAAYKDNLNGDFITGGNLYDGRVNLNPEINSNGINRLLILAAIAKNPKKVLMVGLSIGTWLKLLETFPHIEHIDVVELNPGYLQLIKNYPHQASALKDPRVQLHINDGRRFLKHNSQRYDLIVMNTTYHWRAYSVNILSKEFLKIIQSHLTPTGIFAYNPTDSVHVFATALHMFKYAYLYNNFIIAAQYDWRPVLKKPQAFNALKLLKIDGQPVFANNKTIYKFLELPLVDEQMLIKTLDLLSLKPELITDNNLLTEYKYGRPLS